MGKKRAKRVVAQTRTVRVFEEEELPSGGKIISKNKRRKKSVSKFTFYSPRASCEGFFFFFFSFSGKALFRRKHGATRRLSIPVERRPGQLLNKRVSGFNIGDFLHAQVPSHMVISRCVCVRARARVSPGAAALSAATHLWDPLTRSPRLSSRLKTGMLH